MQTEVGRLNLVAFDCPDPLVLADFYHSIIGGDIVPGDTEEWVELHTATGRLADFGDVAWDPRHACGVVLADGGYPGDVTKGLPIAGTEDAAELPDVHVYHAGTTLDERGRLVTNGGRVLCVTGLGDTLQAARDRAYEGVGRISFPDMRFRTDIGWRELEDTASPAGAS